jgi:hypothetical protein
LSISTFQRICCLSCSNVLFVLEFIRMTARRGIFFNSKSRSTDSNLLVDEKNRSPTKIESSTILHNDDPSSSSTSISTNQSQISPQTLTSTVSSSIGVTKKKLILRNPKRNLAKSIYSGPRKIFSTSYKVGFIFTRIFVDFSLVINLLIFFFSRRIEHN